MTTSQQLHQLFADPPREFGIMPFWFWNDDLDEDELVRQIHAFYAKGFGGFLLHPRVGLSRRVGYLTATYFRFVRIAVETAAALGMKVVLYDEGSYPSGSAAGQVVAANPEHASRAIIARQETITGPATGYWHPNPGRALTDELVAVVAGREIAPDVLDPTTLQLLPIHESELARYELPVGQWRLVAIWHVHSGGAIRGVFPEQEDGHALAPAAGDLLNPAAVASFIQLTHEQYYAHLREHFGKTVIAMFTDEPMVLGRGAKRGPQAWPFTTGFLEEAQRGWPEDLRLWLPALWLDCGARTAAFRQHYTDAVHARLERVFYGAQGRWAAAHGIALTGHPAESNDFGALRQFQWPGQDMVWRWVTPGAESALTGAHSCAPKVATSAAALQGSRRVGSEALGAYGWQLTLDETKWLLDWHLVRGNNLFFLHAVFYSLRGRRAYESEPDLGLHNVWWPHFGLIADYLRRVCWLLSDGVAVCEVAVLTAANNAAWDAAKVLYQQQIDFLYIDSVALDAATVEAGALVVGEARYRVVICDPPLPATDLLEEHPVLQQFVAAGGRLLAAWEPTTLAAEVSQAIHPDLQWQGSNGEAADLRFLHYRKAKRDFYFLVNEGETVLTGQLLLASVGQVERWDPLTGQTMTWPGERRGDRLAVPLQLERRATVILAVDARGEPAATVPQLPVPGKPLRTVTATWQIFDEAGNPLHLPAPGDWAQVVGWELFAGTVHYRTTVTLAHTDLAAPLFLDLGMVGDIGEVHCNGEPVGTRAWAPYQYRLDGHAVVGTNQLDLFVTNTIANRYEGLQQPSGLLGPIRLLAGRQDRDGKLFG